MRRIQARRIALIGVVCLGLASPSAASRRGIATLVDADLGGGLADLLVLTLAVRSPHLDVVGVITAGSDGSDRARVISHWLKVLNRPDIPIGEGAPTSTLNPVSATWPRDSSGKIPVPAANVVREAAEESEAFLQALILGQGSAFAAALIEEPNLAAGVRKVIWTQEDDGDTPFSGLDRELEIGSILYNATGALVACIPGEGSDCLFDRDDWIALANTRSELSEQLTRLAARDRTLSEEGTVLEVPRLLSVIAGSGVYGVTAENRWIRREKNGSFVLDATGERRITLVTSPSAEAERVYLLRKLSDPSLNFRVEFAHFLNGLLRLDSETKEALKGKLDLSIETEEGDEKSGRERMLEYLEYKLRTLKDSGRPSVEALLKNLEAAYFAYSGLGWWFPDEFYGEWRFNTAKESRIHFGIANPGEIPLDQIAASVRIGEGSISQSVSSSTDTVQFEFDLKDLLANLPETDSAELYWRFDCGGGTFERSRRIEISNR